MTVLLFLGLSAVISVAFYLGMLCERDTAKDRPRGCCTASERAALSRIHKALAHEQDRHA